MKDHPIDPTVPIVTLVLDCTTDHRNFHLCKKGGTVHAEEEEEEDDEAHEEEEKAREEDQDDDENISSDILNFAA